MAELSRFPAKSPKKAWPGDLGSRIVSSPINGKYAQTAITKVTLVASANRPSSADPMPASPKASPKTTRRPTRPCPGEFQSRRRASREKRRT